MDRPLVSLIVLSFNQEKFIRQAVQAALKQDYESLEIIISDDCSTDSTYQLICEELEGYSVEKKVVINQTSSNLGVIAHVNEVVKLTRGDLVVLAAGDDISFTGRVSALVNVWKEYGASAVCSNATVISEDGSTGRGYSGLESGVVALNTMAKLGKSLVFGAGMAYEKAVFDDFGPIPETVRNEDMILPFRAALLNGVYFQDIPLLYYRQHSGNLSFWSKMSGADSSEWLVLRIEQVKNLIANYENWIESIEYSASAGKIKFALDEELKLINNNILLHRAEIKLIKGGIFSRWVCLLGSLSLLVKNKEMVLRFVLATFSPGLYARVMQALYQRRAAKKLTPPSIC